jgi:hypothetical protein
MRSLRFAIVWFLLVAGSSAAADLVVFIRLRGENREPIVRFFGDLSSPFSDVMLLPC